MLFRSGCATGDNGIRRRWGECWEPQGLPMTKSAPDYLARFKGTSIYSKYENETQGRVDLLFKPEEGTDKVEKSQEVSGQFFKTRKYMSVLL